VVWWEVGGFISMCQSELALREDMVVMFQNDGD